MLLLGVLIALVLGGISLLHLYWAVGGRRAISVAVPAVEGRPAFTPSPGATVAVAVALAVAALLVLGRIGVVESLVPAWAFRWGTWMLALIFLLRGMGDLQYVGVFKRVRDTRFARWDTVLFSPLCFALALGLGLVSLA